MLIRTAGIGLLAVVLLGCSLVARLAPEGSTPPPLNDAVPAGAQAQRDARGSDPGCGPAERLEFFREPAPYVEPGSEGPPLLQEGTETSLAEARRDGFAGLMPTDRQGRDVVRVARGHGSLHAFLSREPIGRHDTLIDFFADDGVQIIEERPGPRRLGPDVLDDPMYHATPVLIESHTAAMVLGDPLRPGLIPYTLVWSDGEAAWIVVGAVEDPRTLVEIARSMVC